MKSARLSSSLLLVGVVFAALLTLGNAYGTGAPATACEQARPMHNVTDSNPPVPIDPKSGDSPYSFTVEVSEYNPGRDLEVTIVGANDAMFQGFFLQARTTPGNAIVGTFTAPTDDSLGKLLECTNAGDTVTHTNANDKASGLTFTWNGPAVGTGSVQFVGTVAVNHDVFYSAIMSETLTEGAAATVEPLEPTTAETVTSDAITEEFTAEMTMEMTTSKDGPTTMIMNPTTQANMEMTTGNAVVLSSGLGVFILAMIASIIQLFV